MEGGRGAKETREEKGTAQENNIKYLAKQIDHTPNKTQFNYTTQQVHWLKNSYQTRSYGEQPKDLELTYNNQNKVDLADTGRACCGGRTLCTDQNYKSRTAFVDNKFPNWYCSVNHFFLYIKQVTEEIFTNKDCKMNFTNSVGPIGTLDQVDKLLEYTKEHLSNNTMPIIQCKKNQCFCGLCAPKSQDLETFTNIMKKYHI